MFEMGIAKHVASSLRDASLIHLDIINDTVVRIP